MVARRETSGTVIKAMPRQRRGKKILCAPSERENYLVNTRSFASGYPLAAPSARDCKLNTL